MDYLVRQLTTEQVSLITSSYAGLIIGTIAEHDAQAGTDNYEFLHSYLMLERRTSTVADALHMHRNNVNYRIGRIEELYDIDLDDAALRLRTQSLKLIQYGYCSNCTNTCCQLAADGPMPPYSKTLSWVNTCTAKTNRQSEGEGICMDMKQWVSDQIQAKEKKALPVLTFPAAEKLGVTTKELIYSADLQAQAMKYIYDNTDMAAVLAFMDLSVEAEAFGSTIRYSDDEVPTVVGSIVDEDSNVDELVVPDPREGRTGICIEGVRLIAEQIDDKPVIAGCVGPFSLTGRLMDVNEVMFLCYDEPELVHAVLEKTTSFIISYVKELKAAGADGVMMAEPLAGLLSPDLTEEFSNPYVKRIIDETQDDEFIVILHNCGSSVSHTIDSIVETGAAGFHLGNAIDMAEMMPHIPADRLAYGNIDPAATLCHGTHEAVYAATAELLEKCSQYPNFVISSGCDIPQLTPWDNIDAFFAAVHDFYAEKVDEEKTAAAKESQPVVINDMTSRERFFAAVNHEPVDRVPVHPPVVTRCKPGRRQLHRDGQDLSRGRLHHHRCRLYGRGERLGPADFVQAQQPRASRLFEDAAQVS